MNIAKQPPYLFNFTPQIFRYLEEIVEIGEKTFPEPDDEIAIKNYELGEELSALNEQNNQKFWSYLQDIGAIKPNYEKSIEGLKPGDTVESQHKTLTETQAQLDSLTKMRYRELIDDETFLKEKQILTNQIAQLTSQLRETEGRAEKWLELTEKTFDFACYAHSRFLTGDLRTKKEILSVLGSNFVLKDGELTLSLHKYFEPIIQQYPAIEKEYKRLELNKTLGNKAKTAALTTVFTRWQGR